MKFVNKSNLFCFLLICLIALTTAIRKNRFTFKDAPLSSYVNKGFSYLNNDKDIYKDVDKLLGKNLIFNHDIDTDKEIFGSFYVSQENFRSSLNRNVTIVESEDLRKNQEITLKGDYQITTGSDVGKWANGHILRKPKASHIFADTIGRLVLTMNHNKNFPNLHPAIIEAAYKTFYETPNKNYPNHTMADLFEDRKTMKEAIKFFNDYGTHYISQGVYGYRFGFYQEYKNSTTVLKDKDGKNPLPDLTKMSFMQISTNKNNRNKKDDSSSTTSTTVTTSSTSGAPETVTSQSSTSTTTTETVVETSNNSTSSSSSSTNFENSSNQTQPEPSQPKPSQPEPIQPTPTSVIPKDEKKPETPVQTPAVGTSNSTPITAGTKTKPDINQFSIGQCSIDKLFMKSESCNPKNPRPVRFEVEPIFNLFNPILQVKKDFGYKGKIIDSYTMKKIFRNMAYLLTEIQYALDPRILVVNKVEAWKLSKKSYDTDKECLQIKPETIGKIFKDYKQTSKRRRFQEEMMIKDRNIPVASIKNYASFKKEWNVVSSKDDGLYWCYTRTHNMTPEDLNSGLWQNKKFLKDIKVIIDHDAKSYEEAGYRCQEMWSFVDKQGKENRWHFCQLFSTNFLDMMLITDIKFFDFNAKMRKCTSGKLNSFIDGRNYECDCDVNLKELTDDETQGDTYLCVSRKSDPKSKPLKPNQPISTTGPNAPKVPEKN